MLKSCLSTWLVLTLFIPQLVAWYKIIEHLVLNWSFPKDVEEDLRCYLGQIRAKIATLCKQWEVKVFTLRKSPLIDEKKCSILLSSLFVLKVLHSGDCYTISSSILHCEAHQSTRCSFHSLSNLEWPRNKVKPTCCNVDAEVALELEVELCARQPLRLCNLFLPWLEENSTLISWNASFLLCPAVHLRDDVAGCLWPISL